MFLYLIETILEISLVVVVITQIISPAILGGKWFPIFRRKDLTKELTEAEESVERAIERLHIDHLKRKAEALRNPHSPEDTHEPE